MNKKTIIISAISMACPALSTQAAEPSKSADDLIREKTKDENHDDSARIAHKWFTQPKHEMTGSPHDTWGLRHKGRYYLYFLASAPLIKGEAIGTFNNVSLITSDDGVHWREQGPIFRKYPESIGVGLGSGNIWKSPNFANDGMFIMNYGQHFPEMKSDSVLFATSTDLLNWTLLGRDHELKPDGVHHPIVNRYHCVSVTPRAEGGYYGYWCGTSANAKDGGVGCMGFTEDGIHFIPMPAPIYKPLNGPGPQLRGGDFSDIEKIGDRYYVIWWNGFANRVWVSDTPHGVFAPAQRNHLLIGGKRTAIFPRFFRTPDELLLSHASFTEPSRLSGYRKWEGYEKPICPLKKVIVDPQDGAMFLGWWPGNDAGKEEELSFATGTDGKGLNIVSADKKTVDLSKPILIEADVILPDQPGEYCGLRFQCEDLTDKASGTFSLQLDHKGRAAWVFDEDNRILHQVDRDIAYTRENKLRVFITPSLIEAYLGDYLIDIFKLSSRQFTHFKDRNEWEKQNQGKEEIRYFQLTNHFIPFQGGSGQVKNLKAWQ